MSSSVLPLVSGTSLHTNMAAITQIAPYRPYVNQWPKSGSEAVFMLNIGTKVELTIQLNIHWKATAMATAAPRMVFGKISDMSTQQIGPHDIMNDAL